MSPSFNLALRLLFCGIRSAAKRLSRDMSTQSLANWCVQLASHFRSPLLVSHVICGRTCVFNGSDKRAVRFRLAALYACDLPFKNVYNLIITPHLWRERIDVISKLQIFLRESTKWRFQLACNLKLVRFLLDLYVRTKKKPIISKRSVSGDLTRT